MKPARRCGPASWSSAALSHDKPAAHGSIHPVPIPARTRTASSLPKSPLPPAMVLPRIPRLPVQHCSPEVPPKLPGSMAHIVSVSTAAIRKHLPSRPNCIENIVPARTLPTPGIPDIFYGSRCGLQFCRSETDTRSCRHMPIPTYAG